MKERPNTIRVFIALELPAEAKQTLDEVIQKLRTHLPSNVRWFNPSGSHLTLTFLVYSSSTSVP